MKEVNVKIIGLTGGIGTGKSTVAGIFREAGIPVLDADRISWESYLPGSAVHNKIVHLFGRKILMEDGTVNRQALGNMVFKDPEKRGRLEEITHPEIEKRMMEFVRSCENDKKPFCVIEAALIFEKKGGKLFDIVITVSAEMEEQIERLKARDGLPEEEIVRRIEAQLPVREKIKRADFVIDNSGSVANTKVQVYRIIELLMKS